MSRHIVTKQCGFDRNASHSANAYVCACGWSEAQSNAVQVSRAPDQAATIHGDKTHEKRNREGSEVVAGKSDGGIQVPRGFTIHSSGAESGACSAGHETNGLVINAAPQESQHAVNVQAKENGETGSHAPGSPAGAAPDCKDPMCMQVAIRHAHPAAAPDARELLPCPWCGGKPEITKHFRENVHNLLHRCPIVGPISFDFGDKSRHVAAWNRRTPEPAQGLADELEQYFLSGNSVPITRATIPTPLAQRIIAALRRGQP